MKHALEWIGVRVVLGLIYVAEWLRYFGRGYKVKK